MKILTWNIANYNDHPFWEERIGLIVDEIIRLNPDVIALQEVRFCFETPSTKLTGLNTAEQILFELNQRGFGIGYHLAIAPAMYYNHEASTIRNFPCKAIMNEGKSVIWEGLTVISKYPIQEHVNLILNPNPPIEDSNVRNLQVVETGHVTILNTHLSYAPLQAMQNAKEIMSYATKRNYKKYILCGDFNVTPNSEVIKLIHSKGFVKLSDSKPTYPNPFPDKEIDFIFGFNMHIRGKCSYTRTYDNSLNPSDHRGILLTF